MDSSKKFDNPSPQAKANFISKLFFWWLMPFLIHGHKHDLEMEDMYNTLKQETSEYLTNKLERNWNIVCREAKRKKIKPSLQTAIRKTFLWPYALVGLLEFTRLLCFTYGMPIALAAFISHFSEVPRNSQRGWYYGGVFLAIYFLSTVISHHVRLHSRLIGMKVRIACGALVYRKILKLSKASLDETDVGKIVNILSNDLSRFDSGAEIIHYLWIMPIVALLGTYVMYIHVGFATFVGIGVMIIQAVPCQGYLSRLQGKLRFKIATRTDSRVKLMNEITTGIQVIKMYAWEKPFERIVGSLRKHEIKAITQTSYIKSLSTAIQVFTERVTLYIIVIVFVLTGNELTSSIVFSMFQLINTLQLVVCIFFPLALAAFTEAKTSIMRLEEFLLKEERQEMVKRPGSSVIEPGLIKMTEVHASWTTKAITETLSNISFELPTGSLCCLIGNVGSGKSSILQAIIKELSLTSGTLQTGGKISYASQEPWLFVSNIRNNILFGQPFHKDKYYRVVKACALERDFELFPFGDKTNVGEKGVSLSGGQRARINLARAVYRDADIYLLDDPLAAVDPHVAKHLMKECIGGYLKNKTRILVTHQTQLLDQADFLLVLNNGKVEEFKKTTDLSMNEIKMIHQTTTGEVTPTPELSTDVFYSALSLLSAKSIEEDDWDREPEETEELIERGSMELDVYKEYYKAGASILYLSFEILLLIIAQVACNSCDLWVTFWTNNVAKIHMSEFSRNNSEFNTTVPREMNNSIQIIQETPQFETSTEPDFIDLINYKLNPNNLTQDLYIQVYTLFIIFAIILTILRSVVFYRICMNASKKLHNLMFSNILQAKMRFFDSNPSGRILNRFSKDMGAIDEILPMITLMALQEFCVAIGIMTMVFLKTYYMIFPAIILGILVYWFRKIFFKATQDIKRLEGVAKAPTFSYVAASLDGLATIRSANAENLVKKEFDRVQDGHTSTFHLLTFSFQAFVFYLDIISFFFLSVILIQFLLNPNATGGDVGLLLSQGLIVVAMVQLSAKHIAEVENNMTSVERVLQYTKLDKEGPFQSLPVQKPPKSWPEAGRIQFENVYLRYMKDGDPVLKNLSLEIEPGEKIGIVGRTGAGKSTLISALFRLSPIEGIIRIDGIDTGNVGLTDLRSRISIIPQQPTLFSESVRYNLDPFGVCNDSILWKALEAVELRNAIDSLDMVVSEGGSNFSTGQRQLICLARAIVRNNRILVMDEATANVDPYTDNLIQKSIRENFENCTVLTVAHRLNTIMDCDRVIVMDAGEMKEFAAPYELLQNSKGYFSSMVRETGSSMEKNLKQIAKDHDKRKKY